MGFWRSTSWEPRPRSRPEVLWGGPGLAGPQLFRVQPWEVGSPSWVGPAGSLPRPHPTSCAFSPASRSGCRVRTTRCSRTSGAWGCPWWSCPSAGTPSPHLMPRSWRPSSASLCWTARKGSPRASHRGLGPPDAPSVVGRPTTSGQSGRVGSDPADRHSVPMDRRQLRFRPLSAPATCPPGQGSLAAGLRRSGVSGDRAGSSERLDLVWPGQPHLL